MAALLWANFDHEGYEHFHKMRFDFGPPDGPEARADDWNTLHFLINDVFMAFFFAIAAKEVWESMLPGGALSSVRTAAAPLVATAGGMIGPAVVYLGGVLMFDRWDGVLTRGWAIPTATDIAFSYMIARLIFGPGHPAIAFLLLLAIADDAGGLIILAVFYPSKELHLIWLLATVGAVVLGFVLRKLKCQSFWWYLLLPGALCWFSIFKAGLHPALGLIPIIPTLPHAHTDLGIFAREELQRRDALNEFEHWWKNPVEIFLGFFGLMNAGVAFGSAGVGTYLVLCGLLCGKPIGITLFAWAGEKFLGLRMPGGMGYREIVTIGMIAGIGFTVALFVCTAAFKPETTPKATLDAAKLGALLSFVAAPLAFVLARALGIWPRTTRSIPEEDSPGEVSDASV